MVYFGMYKNNMVLPYHSILR